MCADPPQIKVTHLSVSGPMKGLMISCMVDLEASNSPTLMFTASSSASAPEQFERGGSLDKVGLWCGVANVEPKLPDLFPSGWIIAELTVEPVLFPDVVEEAWSALDR